MQSQDLSAAPVAGSVELLQQRMRLAKLQITPIGAGGELYRITIRVVYGDDDLISNPTQDNAACKVSISGSQYCAQSDLSTVVKKRITQ
jgi:hypothetical protein